MTLSRPRLVVGGLLILIAGGFILWLQAGLVFAAVNLAMGGAGLQGNLSAAATGVQNGDYPTAEANYEAALKSSEQLSGSASVPQLSLMSSVPGLAAAVDNWRNVTAAAGEITTSTGNMLILYADLSGKGGGPKIFSDGAIDLARLSDLPQQVSTTASSLNRAQSQLEAVRATTPFSAPLLKVRDKALTEMQPVQTAIDSLSLIAPVLPDALGASGVRRYLVAIDNQAEMRAAGGAPLTLVLVEFDNGRISIPIKGQTSTQLYPPVNAPVKWWGPAANPFFPGNPRNAPMVVTNTHPNLLFSAREMAGAWVGGDFPPVDGVITVDLTAIAAVLDATGPVESEEYGSVDGSRLGQILLVDAYQQYGQADAAKRQDANQKLLDELLTRLLSGDDLIKAAQAMVSTAPGRHVQFWMKSPELEQLAIDSNSAGLVEDPGTGDWSAAYTQNGNQSKVDVFQQRNVLVTVQLDERGGARVTQQMTVTNATPAERPEGPPERIGYETSWLKAAYLMYVPDAAVNYTANYPQSFAVRPFKNHPQLGRGWVDDGFGHRLIRIVGWTAPGAQNAVSVSYDLPAGTFLQDGNLTYRLRALPQSLFVNSTLTVQVAGPNGWQPVPQGGMKIDGSTATVSAIQSAPVDVAIQFEK